ncbi:MAG: hypothetical protein J7577_13435 [Sphingobacteriaceae bacterium]|nr:hypothetical protein [Sphingobacteriaceae bacterium]
MALLKAHEHEQLEVGKFYLVATAVLVYKNGDKESVAVNPLLHNDKQFGFVDDHYHVDGRFGSVIDHPYFIDFWGRTNRVVSKTEFVESLTIEYRKRKCMRVNTGIDPPLPHNQYGNGKQYWNWYRNMLGKSCKGKKCPHLGVTMREQNGVLICPLHNLTGCITTETIIDPVGHKLNP